VSTPWLSPDEQRVWRTYLAASLRVQESVEYQLQHEAGIPHAYYEILVRLSESPDRSLRMSQLAGRAMASKSRVSHAVARLEERGWVERSECPTDGRGQLARLTDAGFAALAAAAPGHVRRVREVLLDALTPEQVDQLGELSQAVLTHLGEHADLPAVVDAPA
jgi:DNA-binding MarR family transcriptional regulator